MAYQDMSVLHMMARMPKVARSNKYLVEFFLPRGVAAVDGEDPNTLSNPEVFEGRIRNNDKLMNSNQLVNILCHTANLPQRALLTYEVRQNSAPVRHPYTGSNDPVTFSFYADENYNTRKYFSLWQQTVLNPRTNTLNFYNEYISDVTITTLDDAGNPTYKVTLYEAYPINVGVVDLSYSSANQAQTVTHTLTYKWWEDSYL